MFCRLRIKSRFLLFSEPNRNIVCDCGTAFLFGGRIILKKPCCIWSLDLSGTDIMAHLLPKPLLASKIGVLPGFPGGCSTVSLICVMSIDEKAGLWRGWFRFLPNVKETN